MKNLLTILLLVFSVSFCIAQELSKEEKKQLLQEIKSLKKSPEKYKFIKESGKVKDIIILEQNGEISKLKKNTMLQEASLSSKSDSILFLTQALVNKGTKNSKVATVDSDGERFRVQIGLYQDLDFTALLSDPKFVLHEYVGGLNRYSIGNFKSFEDALKFKEEMMRLGIKDAFVSEYSDGVRVLSN